MIDTLKDVIDAIVPMTDEDLALLNNMATPFTRAKGTTLLEPGQICGHVFFLTKGFFRMYYVDPEGREINYRFTFANNFMVDFQSFLTQKPSRYYWQAMENAEGLAFTYAHVQQAYQQSPNWDRFGRLMAEKVYQQVNERIEMMQFLNPEQRYQYLLDTQPQLFGQVSLFHLSSYLGITPESLSRIRRRLGKK